MHTSSKSTQQTQNPFKRKPMFMKRNEKKKEDFFSSMEFPEFMNTNAKNAKNRNNAKILETKDYKEIVKTEALVEVNEDPKFGWLTLTENKKKENEVKIDNVISEEMIIQIQMAMDDNRDRHMMEYIELNGIDEYNKNYTMSSSHLYPSSEEEDN